MIGLADAMRVVLRLGVWVGIGGSRWGGEDVDVDVGIVPLLLQWMWMWCYSSHQSRVDYYYDSVAARQRMHRCWLASTDLSEWLNEVIGLALACGSGDLATRARSIRKRRLACQVPR